MLLAKRIAKVPVADVECDEIWDRVGMKEKNKPYETDLLGDTYCSAGIESNAKLILAWHLGRRSAHDARLCAEKLRKPRFLQTGQLAWVFELAFPLNSLHDFGASRRSQ